MSKKQTEFDRFERMKRMEKEQEALKESEKRRDTVFSEETISKKGCKSKAPSGNGRKNWSKELDAAEEFDML